MKVHESWIWLGNWIQIMAAKNGGIVTDKETGRVMDWGQALCRDLYGTDWMNSEEFEADNSIDSGQPVPDHIIERAAALDIEGLADWMIIAEASSE